jgi:uncharacterized Tic20 family protein
MHSRTAKSKLEIMKNPPSAEERIWAVIAHLSAIAMGMGLLMPIVGWSEQRRKSNYTSFQCLQALGYQSLGYTIWILLTLVVLVFSIIASIAGLANAESLQTEMMSMVLAHTSLMFGLIGVYFAMPVIAAVACALGKDFRYPIMGNRLARYLGYSSTQIGDEQTWLNEEHEDRWVTAMGHFSVIIMLWGMLVPLTAWILQGKRSLFLRFQSIQTLLFQVCVTLLFWGGMFLYVAGAFILLGTIGLNGDTGISAPTNMTGLVIFLVFMLIVFVIILIVPLFHIMGQWAGYRVLKGEDYQYPVLGNLVKKRISKSGGEEKLK